MNILFIAREIPYPVNTGVRMRVWNVLKRLADNHDVKLICFGKEVDSIPEEASNVCFQIIRINPLVKLKGIGLLFKVFLGLFFNKPYAVSSRFSLHLKQKIDEVLMNESIDLIMCDSLYLALHVPFDKTQTILNEHNIESIIIERYAKVETNILKKIYASFELIRMKNFENKIWAKFNQCFVCSDIDKKEIESRVKHSNVIVIPNGVDINVFSPAAVERKPLSLIYTGLISWKPNEDAVLYFVKEIYPLVKKALPAVSFTIVGKGPSNEIKKLSQQDASITVTGFVDEVKPYILETEVFIVPLRIGSGTRLKILEAWAMGKAIVSTSIGCEGLDYTDKKDLMVADFPRVFAERIILLLKDNAIKTTLEYNGRKLVEKKYSWDVIGETIKREMEKI